jgi:hypothetical protein
MIKENQQKDTMKTSLRKRAPKNQRRLPKFKKKTFGLAKKKEFLDFMNKSSSDEEVI